MDGVAVGKALLEKTGNLNGKRICELCYLKAFRSSFRIFLTPYFILGVQEMHIGKRSLMIKG